MGKPTILLFDNTDEPTSDERKVMDEIIKYWPPGEEPQPHPVKFGAVDILRALPDSMFEPAFRALGLKWPGWADVERSFSEAKSSSLKKYMLTRFGLQEREIELVDVLLAQKPDQVPLEASPLHAAVQSVLAHVRPKPHVQPTVDLGTLV
jgi:hypothetical protein